MQSVIYAKYHKKPFAKWYLAKCHYAECCGAKFTPYLDCEAADGANDERDSSKGQQDDAGNHAHVRHPVTDIIKLLFGAIIS
jgi:hypothetical protein